jgi:hypothetical protein
MLARYIFGTGLIAAIAIFGGERAGKAGASIITLISPSSPSSQASPPKRLLAPALPAGQEPEPERVNVDGSIVKRT